MLDHTLKLNCLAAGALIIFISGSGCISRPPPPLVPLPSERMPGREELAFKPWRLLIVPAQGTQAELEKAFTAKLQAQVQRYGIQPVSSDPVSNRLLQKILELELQSGRDAITADPEYEQLQADGVITVHVSTVIPVMHNQATQFTDAGGNVLSLFKSQINVRGYYTLVNPATSFAQTVTFAPVETARSLNRPIAASVNQLARDAVRDAATSEDVITPIIQEFPLMGYVIGTTEDRQKLKINRGRDQGVRPGLIWSLILESVERSELGDDLTTEIVIGTAKTVEVQKDYCVVACDSRKTRLQTKLGMKARAEDFAFSMEDIWRWTDQLPIWPW